MVPEMRFFSCRSRFGAHRCRAIRLREESLVDVPVSPVIGVCCDFLTLSRIECPTDVFAIRETQS